MPNVKSSYCMFSKHSFRLHVEMENLNTFQTPVRRNTELEGLGLMQMQEQEEGEGTLDISGLDMMMRPINVTPIVSEDNVIKVVDKLFTVGESMSSS